MNEIILEVDKLYAKARKQDVFKDINFTIAKGEVVGLLGHNGSGKSTMLRLISNQERPMKGQVIIDGKVNDVNVHRSDVVIIPDTVKLIKNLSIMDNFLVITKKYKVDQEWFLKRLKSLKLEPELDITELSKGNQEMVQLLIYFAIDTKLYLLDEPFSAVDIYRREFIQHLVIDLLSRNKESAIVITTHLIAEVQNILDRILYLDHTDIVIDDTVDNLLIEHEDLISYLKEYFKAEVGYDDFI